MARGLTAEEQQRARASYQRLVEQFAQAQIVAGVPVDHEGNKRRAHRIVKRAVRKYERVWSR